MSFLYMLSKLYVELNMQSYFIRTIQQYMKTLKNFIAQNEHNISHSYRYGKFL